MKESKNYNRFSAGTFRIIDANLNRAKEGLRVCEEITRFLLNSFSLTKQLKEIRHGLDEVLRKLAPRQQFVFYRDSYSDIGRSIQGLELLRHSLTDIFMANIQRVKESIRVLEEFSKLYQKDAAVGFKQLRYAVYESEKKIVKKLQALRNSR